MDLRIETIERLHLVLLAGVLSLSFFFSTAEVVASLAVGAGLMAGNLRAMAWMFERAFTADGSSGSGVLGVLVLLKFLLFLGAVGFCLYYLPIDLVWFAAGSSLFIPATMLAVFQPARAVAKSS